MTLDSIGFLDQIKLCKSDGKTVSFFMLVLQLRIKNGFMPPELGQGMRYSSQSEMCTYKP